MKWSETEAAERIAQWLYTDSRIKLGAKEIEETIRLDRKVPSEEDCETLVCGDDDGEVPEELKGKHRHLDRLIAGQF